MGAARRHDVPGRTVTVDGEMIRDLILAAVSHRFGDVRKLPHPIE